MNEDLLREIVRLAKMQREAEAEVEKIENTLKLANARLARIREDDLPSAMAEAGMKEFKLEDGTKITIKDEVYCSISEANKAAAFSWLINEHADGIIKTAVVVSFGRGDRDKAAKLYDSLIKKKADAVMNETVHPQTLKAFALERITNKQPFPMELFGARPISRAIVKLTKGKV